jgi:amino acid transporter
MNKLQSEARRTGQMTSSSGEDARSDNGQLAALGYTSSFTRSMSLWENFALGFTYLSPVVGAYTLFSFGVETAGPPMIWTYLIAGCGMMMVCLIFGEIVSQFPISGGVYPWARRLMGRRWSWMTGWIYAWAMYATIAGAAYGSAAFVAPLIGITVTPLSATMIAVVIISIATLINLAGTRVLARVAMIGFLCEIAGAVLVGSYLLLFHRVQPVAVLFTAYDFPTHQSYAGAFLAAGLVGMVCCYGFEACGDLAEETPDPGRRIPVAMRMTIYIGIAVTMFSVTGLLLAIPDMQAAVSGKVSDPIALILQPAFGTGGFKVILCIILVSFLSCVLSLQAAVSRLLFAYARDRMIFLSNPLSRLSASHVPVSSLIVAWLVPSLIVCFGYLSANALTAIFNFAAVGIYVAFQMVIIAALHARARGWTPSGKFRLRSFAWPLNILALIYGLGAILNILWPREFGNAPWYVAFGQPLMVSAVVGCGAAYMLLARPEQRSDAPAGDAWTLFGRLAD